MTDFETICLQKLESGKWNPAIGFDLSRAFLFGDGLFETMVVQNGKIRFSIFHAERLLEGCRVLGFETSTLSSLEEIERQLRGLDLQGNLRIRWNVYRAGLGKYTPTTDRIEESLIIQEFQPAPLVKQNAYISKDYFVPRSPWSHCKTLNALPYVLANRQRKGLGMDEVILLDGQGYLSEAGSANLFWEKDGVVYTPSLECSCISGIGRKALLQFFESAAIRYEVGQFSQEQMSNADRVFVSNVTGLSYIASIEGKRFDTTPIEKLHRIFI